MCVHSMRPILSAYKSTYFLTELQLPAPMMCLEETRFNKLELRKRSLSNTHNRSPVP